MTGALLHCRCGMTISYNGMKPTTVELVCFGYHPTKCGNQTLCYSTSNLFQLFNHFGSQLQLCALLQCRRKLRGPLQIKRTHLSWWRGAVGTTCNLSGKHYLSLQLLSLPKHNTFTHYWAMCVVSMKEVCSRVRPDACMVGPSRPPKKLLLLPCHAIHLYTR